MKADRAPQLKAGVRWLSRFDLNAMDHNERQFLAELAEMASCLRVHNKWWCEKFQEDHFQAQELFNRGDLTDRYSLARRILSYYESGMGGLHEIVPNECASIKTALFGSTNELLRVYWRELGRESYEFSEFQIIPKGTQVRLIPGAVLYQRPDYPATLVPDNAAVPDQIWSIIKLEGPDVTNMPSYLISFGSLFRSARHEALEVIRDE